MRWKFCLLIIVLLEKEVISMATTATLYETIFEEYPKMLTVEEMCEILNIAKETGYRMIRRGEFEVLKLGRVIRIPKNQVLKYIIDNLEKSQKM